MDNIFRNTDNLHNDGMLAIAKLHELEFGKLKRVVVKGQSVLLTLFSNDMGTITVSAFSSICPHSMGDLAQGWVSQNEIECPLHYYRFDVESGMCTYPKGGPRLRKYPVKVEEGLVFIHITKPSWLAGEVD